MLISEKVSDLNTLYLNFININQLNLQQVKLYPLLEAAIFEFTKELEKNKTGQLFFNPEIKGQFASLTCIKLATELLGFLGCVNAGSFSASFHHLRALIELYATIKWCLKHENSPQEWMKRFVVFSEIEKYRICQDLIKSPIDSYIAPETVEKYREPRQSWLELFNIQANQLKKINCWYTDININAHDRLSTNKLIKDLGDAHALKIYRDACHHVHTCSIGSLATMTRITGFPKYLNQIIFSVSELFIRCLLALIKFQCIYLKLGDTTLPIFNKLTQEVAENRK